MELFELLKIAADVCERLGIRYVTVGSLAIVSIERRNHGDGPLRNRADLMYWAAMVSFGPILLIYLAEWLLQTAFPSGVCDWSQPGAGQRRNVAWLTYQDASGNVIYGGRPMGPPPRSRPLPAPR